MKLKYHVFPKGRRATVDAIGLYLFWEHNWDINRYGYLYRKISNNKSVYFHRELMGARPGQEVDHINGDTLDNRVENLRFATKQQNAANCGPRKHNRTSRFKGVRRRGATCWQARIRVSGREIHLGSFRSEREAAAAYDQAARKHFGAFARLNLE